MLFSTGTAFISNFTYIRNVLPQDGYSCCVCLMGFAHIDSMCIVHTIILHYGCNHINRTSDVNKERIDKILKMFKILLVWHSVLGLALLFL